jgi:hypothetical protein
MFACPSEATHAACTAKLNKTVGVERYQHSPFSFLFTSTVKVQVEVGNLPVERS